jgi:NADH:ubiquinone oxidoreductase subunit 6 (subunit J)
MNGVLVIIALATVGTAAKAMAGRKLLYSVLLLAVSWTGIGAFFLWAGAEFVAFAQVLVYVGAISMVVLFAVVLTQRSREDLPRRADSRSRAGYAVLAGGAVAAVLLAAVARTPLAPVPATPPAVSVGRIGVELMGRHAAALLLAGALLTVALIGAVVIAAGHPAGAEARP